MRTVAALILFSLCPAVAAQETAAPGRSERPDPLKRSIPVDGRVVDVFGKPVAGAELWVAPRDRADLRGVTIRSASDGGFLFGGLRARDFHGGLSIHATAEGYDVGSWPLSFDGVHRSRLVLPPIVLREAESVRGRVVTASGDPVSGARVLAVGALGAAICDEEGRFEIEKARRGASLRVQAGFSPILEPYVYEDRKGELRCVYTVARPSKATARLDAEDASFFDDAGPVEFVVEVRGYPPLPIAEPFDPADTEARPILHLKDVIIPMVLRSVEKPWLRMPVNREDQHSWVARFSRPRHGITKELMNRVKIEGPRTDLLAFQLDGSVSIWKDAGGVLPKERSGWLIRSVAVPPQSDEALLHLMEGWAPQRSMNCWFAMGVSLERGTEPKISVVPARTITGRLSGRPPEELDSLRIEIIVILGHGNPSQPGFPRSLGWIRCDANGEFRTGALPRGEAIELRVAEPKIAGSVLVPPDQTGAPVELRVTTAAEVSGTLFHEGSAEDRMRPFELLRSGFRSLPIRVEPDPEGRFRVPGLVPGKYWVIDESNRFATTELRVSAGEKAVIELRR